MLVVPGALAVFFALIGLVIATLAALFLPPMLWLFVVPVLGLSGVALGLAVRRVRMLRRLVYRVGSGRLTIQNGSHVAFLLVDDLSAVAAPATVDLTVIPSLAHTRLGLSNTASARDYATRTGPLILLCAAGEWVRLSPTDPVRFLTALEQEIAYIRKPGTTQASSLDVGSR